MSEREPANKIEKGARRYREKIHRESRYADTHKNLPFTFSKPKKNKSSNVPVKCEKCGREYKVTENTILSICGQCKHFNRIEK